MILQLDPPLPVFVVGRGNGLAHLVIDYGPEHDLVWVCFLEATGECWSVRNPERVYEKGCSCHREY
jgi:hypothetical protein